jgi:hypothetical protein
MADCGMSPQTFYELDAYDVALILEQKERIHEQTSR